LSFVGKLGIYPIGAVFIHRKDFGGKEHMSASSHGDNIGALFSQLFPESKKNSFKKRKGDLSTTLL
jgi:hypothetical protein